MRLSFFMMALRPIPARKSAKIIFTISASSGDPEYLRDFKLFDCGDVTEKELILKECGWKPAEDDVEKKVLRRRGPSGVSPHTQ
jgi:hypothetical protein